MFGIGLERQERAASSDKPFAIERGVRITKNGVLWWQREEMSNGLTKEMILDMQADLKAVEDKWAKISGIASNRTITG